jgi:hypothetical protein
MVENPHFIQLVMKTVQPAAPHVGQMMDKHMRQHRYHKAALARKIAVNYTTVVNFMRSPDNRVSISGTFATPCATTSYPT